MMKPTEQQASAVTSVFWDIKTFPVPTEPDARLVGPCIKQNLEDLGYSGPLTIFAIGLQTDVPHDVLRALSSTGIVLNHVVSGSIGILGTILDWINSYPPPANLMLISSNPSIFPQIRQFWEYNIIPPIVSPDLWTNFLLQGAPKEDKCSGTGESAYWLCSPCYDSLCKGFENFTTHLSSQEHEQATQVAEDTVPVTSVFWDIKRCPVPPFCDARLVAPYIKQYLQSLGYSGPLTITAIGQLTGVPNNVLRSVSSAGIILNHVAFDSLDIKHVMRRWADFNPPPANILVICPYSKALAKDFGNLRSRGYNVIELFPYNLPYSERRWSCILQGVSLTADSWKEDKCSESGEHTCYVCNITRKGFESFTTHLSSQEHEQKATQKAKDAVAETTVLWDIKRCPVPPDCDARRVAPCIKHFLKDFCFSGPVTINAIINKVTDVPDDVLRGVSSTGIVLNHYDTNSGDILLYMYLWAIMIKPPANIFVICPYSEAFAKVVNDLRVWGYKVIEPFRYDRPYSDLWRRFLLQDSGTLEEDKCSESGEHASWVCSVCDVDGKGFENFITHLSQRHDQKMSSVYWSEEKHEEAVEAGAKAQEDTDNKPKT